MANLVTRKQAAALLGVTVQALDKALKSGRITYADSAKRLFDEAALMGQWQGNRRRQRAGKGTPATVAGIPADPAVPHDETEHGLRKRRLAAEVDLLEQKARTAGSTRVSTTSMERVFFRFYTMGRTVQDAMHPKLLERTDEFCPETHPGYHALYTDTFKLLREAWAGIWLELVQAVYREHPEWAQRWFTEFASGERGPNRKGDA